MFTGEPGSGTADSWPLGELLQSSPIVLGIAPIRINSHLALMFG